MSLTTLLTELETAHPYAGLSEQTKIVVDWIRNYVEEKTKEFKENRESNRITFGRYKGQTVGQVVKLDKGPEYLHWILKQTWFSPDRFKSLHGQITEALKKT